MVTLEMSHPCASIHRDAKLERSEKEMLTLN